MVIKYYIGNTDYAWFNYLSQINPEDVNFWRPGGTLGFNAIGRGAPFILKLKKPYNAIAGIGFLATYSILPISMAWDIFKERNGANTQEEFYRNIERLRNNSNSIETNPNIGCIVLTNPVFFEKKDWIEVPENWAPSIQQGKSYSTDEPIGNSLWQRITATLENYSFSKQSEQDKSRLTVFEPEPKYGNPVLTKVRLGQGAFQVMITDAYYRKCSITGEKTLPALEAAHIKAYSKSGPHHTSNGLLLRSDVHKLFDKGYITITKEYKVEVSKKIKEEFENGREYYKFHGKDLILLPKMQNDRPNSEYIEWHNSIFKG